MNDRRGFFGQVFGGLLVAFRLRAAKPLPLTPYVGGTFDETWTFVGSWAQMDYFKRKYPMRPYSR